MAREAKARWQGGVQDGSGTLALGTGAFEGPYTYKSRFEDASGTNPEELLAAAHAGCFTMGLSLFLESRGNPPESLETDAKVQLRLVDEKPTITKVALRTRGRVPGIDQEAFLKAAESSKATCIVSRVLSDDVEITLDAQLES